MTTAVGAPGRNRLECVDAAKGLAIALVVWGHIVARNPPGDAHWYELSKRLVYSFHMPFFMFLSGLVFFHALKAPLAWPETLRAIGKRFYRLMPAYLLFGALVVAGKLVAARYVQVDNPVRTLGSALSVVLFPMSSPASFLWYVQTLFLLSALVLVFVRAFGLRLWVLLALAIPCHILQVTDFLALDRVAELLLYFVIGGLVARYWADWTQLTDLGLPLWLAAFAVALWWSSVDARAATAAALLSIPALHGLVRLLPPGASRRLQFLGLYAFPIYLMNTMAIGAGKAALAPFAAWSGRDFLFFYVPVLFAAGLFAPIFVKRWIFRRIPPLDRVTN